MNDFKYLNNPIKIGGMTLKNRIIMVAMHHLYTEDGRPTDRFNRYYWERAEGGAAMLVVGACRFDNYGARISTMSLCSDKDADAWRKFTDGMRARDCKCALQLYHAGRYMYHRDVIADDEAIAPSAVYTPFTKETARAMTKEDIDRVIRDWAIAADRAKDAGFDAVEISASAGYLISQFLSPLANVRTDEYGGSFENRCRFPLEVIAAVREAVGADYPILLRLGTHDLVPGSNGSDECLEFAKIVAPKVDLLDLTGGWHESRIPQLTGEVPRGGLLHLARAVKAAVSTPVAMANRMGNIHTAEEAVALGHCDIVAMGRPLVADPELPNKAFSGKSELIRPCVACNQGCLAGTFFDKPVRCLANGDAGREYLRTEAEAAEPKKLLVVGGGPAGCAFAVRASQRGHRVELWESSDSLGGQLRLAAMLPARREFGELISYYSRMLKACGVKVSLGRTADKGSVLSGNFDCVIFATGRQSKPSDLGISIDSDAVPVYTAEEIITENPVLGKRVAVIGGSFIGLEVARKLTMEASLSPDVLFYLARYGIEPWEKLKSMLNSTDRHVAVFEKGKTGAGYEPGIAWPVLGDLGRFNAEIFKNTVVTRITAEGIETESFAWPCDAVVTCPGTAPRNELYEELKSELPCYLVGNAGRLGRAINAIESATDLAWAL